MMAPRPLAFVYLFKISEKSEKFSSRPPLVCVYVCVSIDLDAYSESLRLSGSVFEAREREILVVVVVVIVVLSVSGSVVECCGVLSWLIYRILFFLFNSAAIVSVVVVVVVVLL